MINSFQDILVKSGPHCASSGTPFLQTMLVHFLAHEVQFRGCSNYDYWRGSFILMTQGNQSGVSLVRSHDNSNLGYNIVATRI
jgi:hypothetical protein